MFLFLKTMATCCYVLRIRMWNDNFGDATSIKIPNFKTNKKSCHFQSKPSVTLIFTFNTFTATVDLSQFNSSWLKSPPSTLVGLIFQSRSFSFNQLCDLSLLAGNLYSGFSISSWCYPIHSVLCLHCEIMNLCLSLCSEGEWAVSGCSL